MSMALDEPEENDTVTELRDWRILLAPDVAELVGQYGGVYIDYVDDGFRQGYSIRLGDGGGSCDSGSCGGGCG